MITDFVFNLHCRDVNVSIEGYSAPATEDDVSAVAATGAVMESAEEKVRDWKDLPDDMPEYSDTDSDIDEEEGGEETGQKKKKSDKDGKDVSGIVANPTTNIFHIHMSK